MSSSSHGQSEDVRAPSRARDGKLQVEVPHWAAEVRVYDNLRRFVEIDRPIPEDSQRTGVFELEANVMPGIYEVELRLAGSVERKSVSVHPGRTTRVSRDTWQGQKPKSAAPLAGSATAREAHTEKAQALSRQLTWLTAPTGNSRMFFFVRTLEPARYPQFAEGLALLDAEGGLVTDFSQGVVRDGTHGWMAFTADLPAGFYVLRREKRRGARIRHQPIFLCGGWETQVFSLATNTPSLSTMSLNMAPRGSGFVADNDTVLAAAAVLESLRKAACSRTVESSKVAMLLHAKMENPWLGIVAAYALLEARRNEGLGGPERGDTSAEAVLRHIISLDGMSEHPDLRALRLIEDEDAPPFYYPPLLRAGLRMVQQHATKFAETIPIGSLTDWLLDNLVANSVWTAWREFSWSPQADDRVASEPEPVTGRKAKIEKPEMEFTAVLLRNLSPRTPVFHLSQAEETRSALASLQQTLRYAAPATAATLYDVPLVQLAGALTQNDDLKALPETVILNTKQVLDELLGKVQPDKVSAATGIPLDRVQHGLEQLHQYSRNVTSLLHNPEADSQILSFTTRIILGQALRESEQVGGAARRATGRSGHPASNEPVTDLPGLSPASAPAVTIEECVQQLRTEADRLLSVGANKEPTKANRMAQAGTRLSRQLKQVADNLLMQADFSVITDPSGRMLYGNGAFVALLSAAEQASEKSSTRRAWQEIIANTHLGRNDVRDPTSRRGSLTWTLWRTAINDESSEKTLAYLNVFRQSGPHRLTADALEQTTRLLPELTLQASMFAHGSSERRHEYLGKLQDLIARLKILIEG